MLTNKYQSTTKKVCSRCGSRLDYPTIFTDIGEFHTFPGVPDSVTLCTKCYCKLRDMILAFFDATV